MDKRHMLSIVAALGLVGAAGAQAQNTPEEQQQYPPSSTSSSPSSTGTSDPSSASSPHQREATEAPPSTTETPPTQTSTDPSAASTPHQQESMRTAEAGRMGASNTNAQIVGLEVISPAGDSLGTVVDAVVDPTGAPAYVVISSAKGNTAVPYTTASTMIHDNAVVIDKSKLNNAPKVQKDAWKDNSSKSWKKESDRYWSKSSMSDSSSKDSMKSKKDRG